MEGCLRIKAAKNSVLPLLAASILTQEKVTLQNCPQISDIKNMLKILTGIGCVVERDDVVPEKFTTYFRSVIAFGRVRVVEDEASRVAALRLLAGRFAPGMREAAEREIAQGFARVCLLEFTVEHLTGKEAIELVGGKA